VIPMRPYLVGLGGLLLVLGCRAKLPDMDQALALYQEGRLNEARYEMGRYLKLRPLGTQVDVARQHILLIRRIKRLESEAVEQWRLGNLRGAERALGVMRFLHPAFIEQANVKRLLEYERPVLATGIVNVFEPVALEVANMTLARLVPPATAVLNAQEKVVIHLAREWGVYKNANGTPAGDWFRDVLSAPEMVGLLQAVDTSYQNLEAVDTTASPVIRHVQQISSQLHQWLADMQDPARSSLVYEYYYLTGKREILQHILAVKAGLSKSLPGAAQLSSSR